jgi:hypothetical protein
MYFLLYQHLCIHVTHYLYMHVLTVLHLHPSCGYRPNCTTFSNSQWKKLPCHNHSYSLFELTLHPEVRDETFALYHHVYIPVSRARAIFGLGVAPPGKK